MQNHKAQRTTRGEQSKPSMEVIILLLVHAAQSNRQQIEGSPLILSLQQQI